MINEGGEGLWPFFTSKSLILLDLKLKNLDDRERGWGMRGGGESESGKNISLMTNSQGS